MTLLSENFGRNLSIGDEKGSDRPRNSILDFGFWICDFGFRIEKSPNAPETNSV
jgi:hypothetical protein